MTTSSLLARAGSRLTLWLAATAAATGALAQSAPTRPADCTAWRPSWIASPQPLWDERLPLPLGMPTRLDEVTLRQSLRLSVGGPRLRVVVGNEYGVQPLRITGASVRIEGEAQAMPLSFEGRTAVVVPPGSRWLSDPLELPTRGGERLQVDLHLAAGTALASFHWDARDRSELLSADGTSTTLSTRAFLAEVQTAGSGTAVVAIGDSITDGNAATPGADQRWPDHLARRLAAQGIAVLNAGISGNRLLRDGMGSSALARFDRDVLRHCGVRAVVVLLGTNDIGWPGGLFAPQEALPDLPELSAGFEALIRQARARGVHVIGATLPPFRDALKGTPLEGHYSPQKEALRQALNHWIREAGAFDAVVDFDAVLRDPVQPDRLRPDLDSGDHLHPGDAGYRAMAKAIVLPLLLEARLQPSVK
ncbi:SGNH/GDSL hydrolase family protein [Roseateles asaccharophilus]|uniref:Lysophospholipase L1-like esterase n=1 Tax=Roseateles asaccharophilus TaxID=582607 RepID=A0ABU2ACU4_9BURK|nr:SGNH/GDSL hydrolase family protein [Roseateles asaccharophilus]MDR7335010.1 lysophospholipase L1-like esterase [Roseateles asaccharophilus]